MVLPDFLFAPTPVPIDPLVLRTNSILLPYLFLVFVPVFAFLGVYEAGRGVAALRKGAKFSIVFRELIAATVMVGTVLVLLFIWGEYFHWKFL